jgi:hypothetical protein
LLLGSVDCHAHGLGLTPEGQRGTSTEEESDRDLLCTQSDGRTCGNGG